MIITFWETFLTVNLHKPLNINNLKIFPENYTDFFAYLFFSFYICKTILNLKTNKD